MIQCTDLEHIKLLITCTHLQLVKHFWNILYTTLDLTFSQRLSENSSLLGSYTRRLVNSYRYFEVLLCLPEDTHSSRIFLFLILFKLVSCRSQWPSGLRRGSAAARLLGLRVRIPPGALIFVCCECLSGRGLCDGLISRPEESYRLCCVIVCDL